MYIAIKTDKNVKVQANPETDGSKAYTVAALIKKKR